MISPRAQGSEPLRIMTIFGTRPEAIKMAPVVHALQQDERFTPIVTLTGQHRGMLDQVMEVFGLTADHDLALLRERQTLTGVTVRALEGLSPLIEHERPDAIIVQGDTSTTFVGALAAFYHQVPVIHMEAGLRTGDISSPFPEEANRRLTTQLAALHLPPTDIARDNLLAEGVDPSSISVTGNTVIDALHWCAATRPDWGSEELRFLEDDPRQMVLVTSHRRESWGEPMRDIGRALAALADARPDVVFVFPIHANPVVREAIVPLIADFPNVIITEPQPYAGFVRLMERAEVILTDSGGVQEEGPGFGKPVLVMRESTERPEAISAGTARLVGTDPSRIFDEVTRLLSDPAEYAQMANAVNPYGDGYAALRTVAALAQLLGVGTRMGEFDATRPMDLVAREAVALVA